MATLNLKNVNKVYDNDVQAVYDFNLEIKDKEFIVFVGPSGCGKSTTLRMIAGLEEISNGEIIIDDQLMNDVAPKDRDIAMVFQSYALYPHMSVYDNMAFGLKLRKLTKEEIDAKVQNAANILGLTKLLDRKPKLLSGGQRQRVALGRAIVRNPKVFLMDEPLSNLDAKLRVSMRAEIIKLHKELSATTIYVTHDQTEAMTMADRIVVMKDGYIQQIGTPKEIYDNPNNLFVAGFTGSPAMNFLNGQIIGDYICIGENKFLIPIDKQKHLTNYVDKEIILGIRPENIHIYNPNIECERNEIVNLEVEITELLGYETIIYSKLNNQKLSAKFNTRVDISTDDFLTVAFDMNSVHFFDCDTGLKIVNQ